MYSHGNASDAMGTCSLGEVLAGLAMIKSKIFRGSLQVGWLQVIAE